MTKLEILYDDIYNSGTEIIDSHFSETKKAASLYDGGGDNIILLDSSNIIDTYEEYSILLVEEAHIATSAFYTITSEYNKSMERTERIRHKGTARRHAIETRFPYDEIKPIFDKCFYYDELNLYEFAECLGITVSLARNILDYYIQKGQLVISCE